MGDVDRFDVVVVGAGLLGAAAARDAAGRGAKVLLLERDDLGSGSSGHTSLMADLGPRVGPRPEATARARARAEREILLHTARHIVRPIRMVLPHGPWLPSRLGLRWSLRRDDASSTYLERSASVDFSKDHLLGDGLRLDEFPRGFSYGEARVDDARLVVAHVRDAAQRGADVRTRTAVTGIRRDGEGWLIDLESHAAESGESLSTGQVSAASVIDAAGAAAGEVAAMLGEDIGSAPLVKTVHVVLPRVIDGEHGAALHHEDGRYVTVIPYENRFSLLSGTDVPYDGAVREACVTDAEAASVCAVARRFLERPVDPADALQTFVGVRARGSQVRRLGAAGAPPAVLLGGGELVTHRLLAEQAVDALRDALPSLGPAWTASSTLPGADIPDGDLGAFRMQLAREHKRVPAGVLASVIRRHGNLSHEVLGDAAKVEALGTEFVSTFHQREVEYLVRHEWARTVDDVLWRRTKHGVLLDPADKFDRLTVEAIAACVRAEVARLEAPTAGVSA